MNLRLVFLIALVSSAIPVSAAESRRVAPRNVEQSIVLFDVKRKQYDFFQPWATPMQNLQKAGVVISDREIITTADGLADLTLVRLQKQGRGTWYVGKVKWIDYHANLALVTADDESFWKGLKPIDLAASIDPNEPMQIRRWRSGKLESRQAEFNRFTVDDAKLSFVQHVQLEVNSEITGAGWSEPLISDGKVIGLLTTHNGNTCVAIPSPFIRSMIEARKAKEQRSLGYFDFYWQQSENPTTLEFLRLTGEPRGVVVIEVPKIRPENYPLKPRDVILEIDGFPIDTSGDYRDPDFGFLMLENLSTRERWAGDDIKMKILRAGKVMDIKYTIPKVDYAAKLVPEAVYDQRPEYLIVGGLIFQPLSNSYLQSWGADWRRRAPFRLSYFNNQPATKDRPSIVVLSQVLPDAFNLGYQENRFLALDKVNGKLIATLQDLDSALQEPTDGYHVIEFLEGDALRKMVLDAKGERQATERILARYGIERDRFLSPVAKPMASQ